MVIPVDLDATHNDHHVIHAIDRTQTEPYQAMDLCYGLLSSRVHDYSYHEQILTLQIDQVYIVIV